MQQVLSGTVSESRAPDLDLCTTSDSEMLHKLHRVERRFKPGWVSRAYAASSLSVCLPRKAGEAGNQGWLRRGHSTFSEAGLQCPLPYRVIDLFPKKGSWARSTGGARGSGLLQAGAFPLPQSLVLSQHS